MSHIKTIFTTLVLLYFSYGYSQTLHSPLETLKEKRVIIYGIDNRRTHIHKHNTVIYGVYTGVSFGKKLRLKLSISGTPFEIGKFVDDNGILKKNRLLFFSLGEEFDFYKFKRFGMTTYIQAGIGKNYYRELNRFRILVNKDSELIIPIEIGLHFSYDILSYLKLKTGFGWRFVLPNNSTELSGYYMKLGLSFSLKKFIDARTRYL